MFLRLKVESPLTIFISQAKMEKDLLHKIEPEIHCFEKHFLHFSVYVGKTYRLILIFFIV